MCWWVAPIAFGNPPFDGALARDREARVAAVRRAGAGREDRRGGRAAERFVRRGFARVARFFVAM
jgi:hypothetical protein